MPLYIDLHEIDGSKLTVDQAYQTHLLDLAVQGTYGVTFHKYWLSSDQNHSFCLMEGPSKDACRKVHEEAHGYTACNIIEISEKEFELYLGMGDKDHYDIARTPKGEIDIGFRSLVKIVLPLNKKEYDLIFQAFERAVADYNGSTVYEPGNEFTASFIYAWDAVNFARSWLKSQEQLPVNTEIRIGVINGKPVDQKGDLPFGIARDQLGFLVTLGKPDTLYIDFRTFSLLRRRDSSLDLETADFLMVDENEMEFLERLNNILLKAIPDNSYDIESLSKELWLSKAQTYRKIKAFSGMSPNQLLRDLRLRKALELIRSKELNVSEVAFEVGFNNASYFAQRFQEKYGKQPSKMMA